ncbi:MAG: hydroxymethylglutaryl-CoA lyase, partial [Burkholderiales bacterium]|nr:hydroxymethylglutaryl-CoA lyase [Burkholderiales bacterium]
MHLPQHVKLVEVGPRDGLQNEANPVPLEVKVELIDRLSAAGLPNVEAAAFVSPRWVPQMADGAEVMARIRRRPGTVYSALVPNMKGMEAALAAGVGEVVVFSAASEAFAQANINCSIAESIARFEPVAQAAKAAGVRLRGSISCALGCPYQGEVEPRAVVDVVQRMAALGCDEIDIADTIGVGTPGKTQEMIAAVARHVPLKKLAGHFHDTYGMAIANIYSALE